MVFGDKHREVRNYPFQSLLEEDKLTVSLSSEDLAKDAYLRATKHFNEKFTDEESQTWLRGHESMEDVQQAVDTAKRKYDLRAKHTDARRWLRKLSKGIMYYAVILDTLAQHHPEYVSLAWGAMKFVFVVSITPIVSIQTV